MPGGPQKQKRRVKPQVAQISQIRRTVGPGTSGGHRHS
jgi:hypothetical protein